MLLLRQCVKCGSTWITTRYDNLRDQMRHECGCGYVWHTQPNDKRPDRGA